MKLEFETLEEFSVASEVSDATVTVKLRRMLNHKPTGFSAAPYGLGLAVGSVCHRHYGMVEKSAREKKVCMLLC
ncbi:conserved hypothetical protein [Burkholderia latens]|uniref:hypothetical protein n=1 Tax=Burkholderia latens TaxID=488446 RepID=UPI0039A5A8F1